MALAVATFAERNLPQTNAVGSGRLHQCLEVPRIQFNNVGVLYVLFDRSQ